MANNFPGSQKWLDIRQNEEVEFRIFPFPTSLHGKQTDLRGKGTSKIGNGTEGVQGK